MSRIDEGEVSQRASEVISGAVDHYHAAARLESNGLGQAVTNRLGYDSTFAYARTLVPAQLAVKRTFKPMTPEILRGLARGLILFAGLMLCLLVIHGDEAPLAVFGAGAAGWLAAQTSSAVLWWGLGARDPGWGNRLALIFAVAYPVIAGVVFGLRGHLDLTLWVAWGVTAAPLMVIWGLRRAVMVMVFAALIGSLGWLLPSEIRPVPAELMLCLLWGLTVVTLGRRMRRSVVAGRRGWRRTLAFAVIQVAAPVVMLAFVLNLLGDQFLTVALAAMLASALSEPLLQIATARVHAVARTSCAWSALRRRTAALGVAVCVSATLSGLITVEVVAWYLHTGPGLTAIALALSISTFAAGGSLLLRLGEARAAAGLAVIFSWVVSTLIWLVGRYDLQPGPVFLIFALCTLVPISALAARQFSHPDAW
ncbi:MAG: hypothetical protein ACK5LN_12530 [Propioniciclava sp.]